MIGFLDRSMMLHSRLPLYMGWCGGCMHWSRLLMVLNRSSLLMLLNRSCLLLLNWSWGWSCLLLLNWSWSWSCLLLMVFALAIHFKVNYKHRHYGGANGKRRLLVLSQRHGTTLYTYFQQFTFCA